MLALTIVLSSWSWKGRENVLVMYLSVPSSRRCATELGPFRRAAKGFFHSLLLPREQEGVESTKEGSKGGMEASKKRVETSQERIQARAERPKERNQKRVEGVETKLERSSLRFQKRTEGGHQGECERDETRMGQLCQQQFSPPSLR